MIPVMFILGNIAQIYDFFFEERIIYLCKYEEKLSFNSCNIAANLEKQRLKKLDKEMFIYRAKDDIDEFFEKKQNTINNILRYRVNSCNPYGIAPRLKEYYTEVTDYYKNLKHCREFYEDYIIFCSHNAYPRSKDCHDYSYIIELIEEGQNLYK